MAYPRLPVEDAAPLTRGSPFSYACAACGRCCRHKGIRVGPYEILRLARARGLSTTAFIADFTEAGGTVLRTRDDGACPFLAGRGCAVHADRPLVCRLYPLGREVDAAGLETFILLAPEPGSEGRRAAAGTVADYLARQGVAPFLAQHDRYAALYDRMLSLLARLDPAAPARLPNDREALDAGALRSTWLDIDATLAAPALMSPDEAAPAHRAALAAWLDELEPPPAAAPSEPATP